MDNLKMIIAKNIAALRMGEHLTQAELAERLNYSDKAVSKWERGESLPDITVIKAIADMFGVTVDWLLCEHGEDEKIDSLEEVRLNREIRGFTSFSRIATPNINI